MKEMVITGISALAGGFLGSFFTRQTQHHKWLLERRSEAFSRFIQLLDEGQTKASEIFFDRALSDTEQIAKALDQYQPAILQARIVRLYLPRTLRNTFWEHARSYWSIHIDVTQGIHRGGRMVPHFDAIQDIFEQELSPYFWLRPLGRQWRRITNRWRPRGNTANLTTGINN
ncbi:MAG: hypothetical protein FD174_1412 [Geobacteraceae bacterium]|nr:MAG: hypothetical protein FD174_1412 [Geobacteraceae bacterium]